ncbi:hypothetical protein BS17DRAFT_35099 [Gyrodon lividus]|nr:hypothetical protein BS17DRAFT_35099 [Gyrodon lividus]
MAVIAARKEKIPVHDIQRLDIQTATRHRGKKRWTECVRSELPDCMRTGNSCGFTCIVLFITFEVTIMVTGKS